MPFLQAAFCLKGFDDRNRFFATTMISLIGFIVLSTLFSSYFILSFIILLILTVVLSCSTTRRLHDAQLTKNWQLVPGCLFLLTGVLCLLIDNSSSYYLLVLPLLSTTLLLTYPSKGNKSKKDYILGYYGPVDLSSYTQEEVIEKPHNLRIEPTLMASDSSVNFSTHEEETKDFTPQDYQEDYDNRSKGADIGELIRLKFLSNRKLQLAVIVTVSLIFVAVFIHSAISSSQLSDENSENVIVTEQQTLASSTKSNLLSNKQHLLTMPDNFNLYLSEYKGVIIHWQADNVEDGELWSQSSAQGDKSCQSITFNKGSAMRPLSVSVEKGSEYFASFSPLDSEEIIKALAFRGKFTLCGYSFSLKGTQALLGKHNEYAPFLD